jgi:hypothetical protein
MLQIIRKYPVISYLFLTYLISFVFWFLPVITIVRKENTYFFFLLGMFGPMIAGYLMMLIQAGERIHPHWK